MALPYRLPKARMPAPILDWSAAAEAGSTQAGGKGWQLGRLAQLGVPVPEGFVIGASASVSHLSGKPLPAAMLALLAKELEQRDTGLEAIPGKYCRLRYRRWTGDSAARW